ncbi:MAG: response regulator [Candidatus Margulisiibacteriota bacterium]|jgi:two-component system phosphate regulon response regulator PhoB
MNIKILIINNQSSLLEVMKLILTTEGYDVIISDKYDKFLSLAIDENPDAIILDNETPRIPGELMATLLKKNEITQNIPILLLINNGGMTGGIRLESAASAHLLKPFKPEALINSVKKLF